MDHPYIGNRVLILGCPGSGKSTFARALAARTGLPLIHLDSVWWRADGSHISRDEFDRALSELLAGEKVTAAALVLYARCANGVSVELDESRAVIDDSAVDSDRAGTYTAKVSYTLGEVTHTADLPVTVFANVQAMATDVKVQLQQLYASYAKDDYTAAYYAKLTEIYQAALADVDRAADTIALHALLSDTKAAMDAVMTLQHMKAALESQRAQMIVNLESWQQPDLYAPTDYQALCNVVSTYTERLRAVSPNENYDTAQSTLDATYREALAHLEKIGKQLTMLTPYDNDPLQGGWYVNGGAAAVMSDKMPQDLQGVSATLADKNANTRYISAAYMFKTKHNSTELLSATDGSVSLGFWVYISDIAALGKETGFFIGISSHASPTEGDTAGRYNIGNARMYVNEENGFVSGWNYVEIPATSFDYRDQSYWQDYTQINFSLRTMGTKSTQAGRTHYPAEWKEGTEVLVTGLRLVYGTSHTKIINALSVQPNALHQARKTEIAALESYVKSSNYSASLWSQVQSMIRNVSAKIDAMTDIDAIDALVAQTRREIDSIPTLNSAESLTAERESCLQTLTELWQSMRQSEYAAADWTRISTLMETTVAQLQSANNISQLQTVYHTAMTELQSIKRTSVSLAPTDNESSQGVWQQKNGAAKRSNNLPDGLSGQSVVLGHKNSNLQFVASSFTFTEKQDSTEFLSASAGSMSLSFWIYIEDIEMLGNNTTGFFICLFSDISPVSENGNRGRYNCGNARTYITTAGGFVSGWNHVSISNAAFDQNNQTYWGEYSQICIGLRAHNNQGGESGYEKYPAAYVDKDAQILIADVRMTYNDTPQTAKQVVLATQPNS